MSHMKTTDILLRHNNTHYSASLPSVGQNYHCITCFFKCSGKIVKNKKICYTSGEIYSFFHMLSFFYLFIYLFIYLSKRDFYLNTKTKSIQKPLLMSRWLYCMVLFCHHFRKNSLLSIQVIYTHLEANENKKSQAAQMALLYWNSCKMKHFLLMKTVDAVSYHARSCHTERGFILTTWSAVNHLVGLSHIEPEADGPTVELTMLMLRNWKKVVRKKRENIIFLTRFNQ